MEEKAPEAPVAEEKAAEEAASAEQSVAEAEEEKATEEKQPSVRKKVSVPGENPHWAFTVSSCVAMVCLLLWTVLIVIQFLNQWQGMEIQIPGLQFLSLGR